MPSKAINRPTPLELLKQHKTNCMIEKANDLINLIAFVEKNPEMVEPDAGARRYL